MAHAQKPDLVFQRNGRVHLNRRGCQFSRMLAAEECGHTVEGCWLPTPFASFPFTSPLVRHRVPSDSERAIPSCSTEQSVHLNLEKHQENCLCGELLVLLGYDFDA